MKGLYVVKKLVLKSRIKSKSNPVKNAANRLNITTKGDIDDYIFACSWHGIKKVSER